MNDQMQPQPDQHDMRPAASENNVATQAPEGIPTALMDIPKNQSEDAALYLDGIRAKLQQCIGEADKVERVLSENLMGAMDGGRSQLEDKIRELEAALNQKDDDIKLKNDVISGLEREREKLQKREDLLQEREQETSRMRDEIHRQTRELDRRGIELDRREEVVKRREDECVRALKEINDEKVRRADELLNTTRGIAALGESMRTAIDEHKIRVALLDKEKERVAFESKESALRLQQLQRENSTLDQKMVELNQKELQVGEKEKELKSREAMLKDAEADLIKLKNSVDQNAENAKESIKNAQTVWSQIFPSFIEGTEWEPHMHKIQSEAQSSLSAKHLLAAFHAFATDYQDHESDRVFDALRNLGVLSYKWVGAGQMEDNGDLDSEACTVIRGLANVLNHNSNERFTIRVAQPGDGVAFWMNYKPGTTTVTTPSSWAVLDSAGQVRTRADVK
jgi:myosin heavy subunit